MDYVIDTLGNLLHQTAFFNLSWGNYVMIACSHCIWYAFGKHLSGYYDKPGGEQQRCRRFTVLFLYPG